jgi:Zn-dependent metalloprotease
LTGLVWDRYQQYAAPLNVFVDGGQMTVIHDGSQVVGISGVHYAGLTVTTTPELSPSQAVASASLQTNPSVDSTGSASVATMRSAQLRVDPATGRQFYRVTSAAPGEVTYQDVDANTGAVLETWTGIETDAPSGKGIKGDTKTLGGDTLTGPGNVLTSPSGAGGWRMVSADGRFKVSDAGNGNSYPSAAMTDADNVWTGSRQLAAVDAQYYAALTENFYATKFNYDLPGASCVGGQIHSVVHYSVKYVNAFWDPIAQVMVYGDGGVSNGTTFSQMSGAQDVVSHELSHAVTSCNSNLDYIKESGALNEAFSDIMGTTAEFEEEEPNSSNCVRESSQPSCADWWLGEDLVVDGTNHAFRSLAKPQVLGQPSHFSQRVYANTNLGNCVQGNDYCGVHTNSGIANQAFYLLAKGGRNSRCSGPSDPQADCDVSAHGVGVDHASNIFFRAWMGLTSTATFCEARNASVAAAQYLAAHTAGYTEDDVNATDAAWRAVGLSCGGTFGFRLNPASDTAVAKPGGTADVAIHVISGTSSSAVTFSISDPQPASASFSPNPDSNATSLHFDVPGNATAGVFPLTVSGTDGTTTQKVSLTLIVDGDVPTAQVTAVTVAADGTVSTDGHVPLSASWSTSDATSGVASGGLDVDSVLVAIGTGGPTTYSSADGSHQLQASATDFAGNSTSSDPLSVTQTSMQETPSASLVYKKTWATASVGTPWGTTRYSKTKAATASYTFSGTDVAWVSSRGPKRGKAKVYIDGGLMQIVDLHSSTSSLRKIVFVASGLSAGQHTIKIYVNGTTGRPRVDVDGFIVLNQ